MDTPDDQEEILFKEALKRAIGPDRKAFLDEACAADTALRERLDALLRVQESPAPFLESPVIAAKTFPVVVPSVEEPAGTLIGPYKLLEKIGEGGCGVVYVAEQTHPVRRRVALKLIKPGMDTRAVIGRFEAERQALALMDHPNIAKVLDAGATSTGRPYFVMELVRGTRITDYCDQKQLSTEDRLKLFVQVCHAVQHAHQKGVIHRDIKPSNILVMLADDLPVPKIIDFGIAKAIGEPLTDKTVYTRFEQFMGTPAYMSPEQAGVSGLDVDTRSDIYALGVLLYELLTGQTPFDQKELISAGVNEMRRIIREQEPLRPSTRISILSKSDQTTVARSHHSELPKLVHLVRGDLDWIAMKCLEKDRTRRYETADGLANDVRRHLQEEPVQARPPARLYRFTKLVRRNRRLFALGSSVVVALLFGLGLSTWLFWEERAARLVFAAGSAVVAALIGGLTVSTLLFWQERAARRKAVLAEEKAQAEAVKSRQVAQFLKDMLRGVGGSVAEGHDTTMLREMVNKAAERLDKSLKEQPEIEGELCSTIGDVYASLGLFSNAEEMHRKALSLRRALWGNLNTKVADSLDSLGCMLHLQTRISEAESAIQEALNLRASLLGPDNAEVATSLCHLAEMRLWKNRPEEAERLYRQSLDLRRRLLGDESLEVMESLSGLSFALSLQEKWTQAKAAAHEALAIQKRTVPEEERLWRTRASNPLGSLGWILLLIGKLEEVESVLRRDIRQELNLADFLRTRVRIGEAEPLYRAAVAISRRVASDDFGLRQWMVNNLSSVLRKQGEFLGGESLYTETLEAGRKLPPSSKLAAVLAGFADLLRERGRLDEAESMYTEGLELCRSLDPNHFERRQWLASGLASLFKSRGQVAAAEPLYREALACSRKVWPNDFKRWEWQFNDLVEVLEVLGKSDEAEKLRIEMREGNAPDRLTQR